MKLKMYVVGCVVLLNLIGSLAMADTPEPTYKVLHKAEPYEVRAYTPQLVAEVVLTGPEASTNTAFNILAGYIFKKYPSGSIGMTAPVTVQETQAIGMTAPVTVDEAANRIFMRFYLPERYTLATIPQPDDARITLKQLPAQTVAVVTFSGWLTQGNIRRYEGELRDWLAAQGVNPTGPAERQGYNPPWTLPWWRRNEVWLPVVWTGK